MFNVIMNVGNYLEGETYMKKVLVAITILSLFAGVANLSSQAVTTDNSKDRGYISVNTTAQTELTPNVADISFSVKTSDAKSMQKATLANKEISDKVYAELKALINQATGDYIKTSDFNASPVYSYSNSKRNLDKYEVSNRVVVHTKSIENIGKMIDKAIAAGATNVDSLSFSVSNYDSQCDQLINQATKKAYNRASMLAKTTNTVILGVSSLNTSCSSEGGNSRPRFYMAKNMLSAAAADSAPESTGMALSEGVIKINANVNASFFVK